MSAEEMKKQWLVGPEAEYNQIVKEVKASKTAVACTDLSGEVIAMLREKGYIVKLDTEQWSNGSNYKVSLK